MIEAMSIESKPSSIGTNQKKQVIELIKSLTAKGDHIEANLLYRKHFSAT